MKAFIDGKKYDTETAEEAASWDNGQSTRDFEHCAEALYRTKKGNWFLKGEGGPMTKYARFCGDNTRCGGSAITPLTAQEAFEWCEKYNMTETIEKYFPDMVEEA